MSSTAKSDYFESAEQALAELDSEKADKMFLDLVLMLEEAFNKNQKDVAAELQRLAKEIEGAGRVDESLRFKQRTCEVMLRRSMAERRRKQPQAPPAAPPKELKTLTQMIFICFCSDPAAYSQFLQTTGLNQELRSLADGSRWLRSKESQLMFLCRMDGFTGFFPLFLAPSREGAGRHLQDSGSVVEGEELDVCGMKLLLMRDKTGQRFFLGASEVLQSL